MALTKLSNGMYKSEHGVFFSKRLYEKKRQEEMTPIINLFLSGQKQTGKDKKGLMCGAFTESLRIGKVIRTDNESRPRTVSVAFEEWRQNKDESQ